MEISAWHSGCRAGSRGTCQIAIFSGQVECLEKAGFETESGTRLTGIGVAKTDLIVDASINFGLALVWP